MNQISSFLETNSTNSHIQGHGHGHGLAMSRSNPNLENKENTKYPYLSTNSGNKYISNHNLILNYGSESYHNESPFSYFNNYGTTSTDSTKFSRQNSFHDLKQRETPSFNRKNSLNCFSLQNQNKFIPSNTNINGGSVRISYNYKNKFNKFNQQKNAEMNSSINDNTEVLSVHIKLSEETKVISFGRYDDALTIAKKFCVDNNLNESLIKVIVGKIFAAMNSVYAVYNTKINQNDKEYLQSLHALHKSQLEKETNKNTDKQIFLKDNIINEDADLSSISCVTNIDDENEDYLFNDVESEESFSKLNNSF